MKLLLVYPPFAPPTVPPYSLAAMKGKNVKCLDLNAMYHRLKFPWAYASIKRDYPGTMQRIARLAPRSVVNNRLIREGRKPEFFSEFLNALESESPTHVAFSVVYSSQAFYAGALAERLSVPVYFGGPAVPEKLKRSYFPSAHGFLCSLGLNPPAAPDFSGLAEGYLSKKPIIPVRATRGCAYAKCAFCTQRGRYRKLPPALPKEGYVCFIDDMLTRERLLEVAQEANGIKWWAQLRPTADIADLLPYLASRGLASVAWGVESGSDRMLGKMRKGTDTASISRVLAASRKAGIINTAFVMFGFPGETEDDCMQTVRFLLRNRDSIDLVSSSVFGLQEGSAVCREPDMFGISIRREKRRILDDRLTYTTKEGLTQKQAAQLKRKHEPLLRQLNRLPGFCVLYKEQTLFWQGL